MLWVLTVLVAFTTFYLLYWALAVAQRLDKWRKPRRPRYSVDRNLPVKSEEFRSYMEQATDFAIDYLGTLRERKLKEDEIKSPGDLYRALPLHMPQRPEPFDVIMRDLREKIVPYMGHWLHPQWHSYFPSGCSFPDIVVSFDSTIAKMHALSIFTEWWLQIGDAIISSLGVVQFSWDAAPAFTELEIKMVNWLGRAIGLPQSMLFDDRRSASAGTSGGTFQPSASDSVFVAMMAARHKKLRELVPVGDLIHPPENLLEREAAYLPKLVAYISEEAHSCYEKAAMMCMVKIRGLPTDEHYALRKDALEEAIARDEAVGLIPFFVGCTSGTTAIGAFDNLEISFISDFSYSYASQLFLYTLSHLIFHEAAMVAKRHGMWSHSDGAYGGAAFICPEFRHLARGIGDLDSFNMNLHKLFLISNTCGVLWYKDKTAVRETFLIDPLYLQRVNPGSIDFRHYTTALSRRTKALKVWFLLRLYGLEGMQAYIRRLVMLAQRFKKHVESDGRFEIVGDTHVALVCFRVKKTSSELACKVTEELRQYIVHSRRIHLIKANVRDCAIIRVNFGQERLQEEDIDRSWSIIKELSDEYWTKGTHDSTKAKLFHTNVHTANVHTLHPRTLQRRNTDKMAYVPEMRQIQGATAPPLYETSFVHQFYRSNG